MLGLILTLAVFGSLDNCVPEGTPTPGGSVTYYCPTIETDPLKLYGSNFPDWGGADFYYEWPVRHTPSGEPYYFNPWTAYKNAAALCDEHYPALADELVGMIPTNAGRVVYKYAYNFEGTQLTPPWYSAFGNGITLAAVSALYECYGDPLYLWWANHLFAGLMHESLWTGLPEGRWFEEYPLAEGSRVLNGHIYAVWGLHYYYHATGNTAALKPLVEGIEAVAAYGWEYRRPGQINLYDLKPPVTADYGPARAIHQQDQLCLMTLDPVFRQLRDAFAADMAAYDKPYRDCDL